ncbi:hypothetical protein ABL78_3531 [Leptomonas seymouri]|uniref:Uncharacterized protein n=1 Tax=Leptomonas seymouri TaxID=5684 RepID=A0A0N0P6P2_LEPSE|nr:hypothetical protein ABL78_3531 [Leptomonas seymouri]|eukprot:KPI87397.1 hypothetical protein ABL78_3531 [Leptomonas seymouri]
MAACGPDPSDFMPMVGDVTERNVSPEMSEAQMGNASHVATPPSRHEPTMTLRPIQAVVGQAFPFIRARRFYGRPGAPTPSSSQSQATGAASTSTAATRSSTTALKTSSYVGLSAHIQPQDDTSARAGAIAPRLPIPEGGSEPMLPAGGSVHGHLPAHQWSTAEFQQLQSGYYVAPVHTPSQALGAATAAAPLTGEDFFTLLFQCLRSTVRKHQQLALEVLVAHLQGLMTEHNGVSAASTVAADAAKLYEEAAALRERCLHGPNCGPCLFFLLEVLTSAGHPAMVELAATCLLLLLHSLPRGGTSSTYTAGSEPEGCWSVALWTDAISELGSPAGDAPGVDEEEEDEGSGAKTKKASVRGVDPSSEDKREGGQDDAELPFSEVSELLRGPDARYGLEQLGFTNRVLAAMQLLLYTGAVGEVSSTQQTSVRADRTDPPPEGVVNGQRHNMASSTEAHLPTRHGQVLFLELLLCGGVGIGHRAACRRVAEDSGFLCWMEGQLSSVVLGHRSLDEVMELLCVLQHLVHTPAALRSLMRGGPGGEHGVAGKTAAEGALGDSSGGATTATTVASSAQQRQHQRFHETWLLFFTYVSSTAATEVRTVRQVFAILSSMLILRMCARQGSRSGAVPTSDAAAAALARSAVGLVQDMSDTLLTEGMAVGGALVLEMWFLQCVRAGGFAEGASQPDSFDSYFLDAARTSLQLCRRIWVSEDVEAVAAHAADGSTAVLSAERPWEQTLVWGEAAAAQSFLQKLQWLSNANFFATYITHMRQRSPVTCYTLSGDAVDTQKTMQYVVRHVVMDTARIKSAFARFTSPFLSPGFSATKAGSAASLNGASSSALAYTTANTYAHGWASAIHAVLRRWGFPTFADQSGSTETSDSCAHADARNSNALACFSPRSVAVLYLALEAAALYANTRLAVALADVYPAVARDIVTGYARLLTHAYEEACLRLRDCAAARLQVDELCTMTEAVQLLQCWGDSDSSDEPVGSRPTSGGICSTSKPSAANFRLQYKREALVGAFFLLHSIAISKHCLDVVPLVLPLLLSHSGTHTPPAVSRTSAATPTQAGTSLLASIQSGIELATVPVMLSSSSSRSSAASLSVTGTPRSWVLYPLYDSAFADKGLWAQWLRGLLGLHHRVKDVVGWDGVLSHTLLWMLAHRHALWPVVSTEGLTTPAYAHDRERQMEDGGAEGMSSASADALCALAFDLCGVLHDQCSPAAGGAPREGAHAVMAAASRTLEISLAAYSDVPSEEGLPLLLHAVLAYVAAHCSARTVLAVLQVLLVTPILYMPAEDTAKEHGGSSFQYASATTQVCAWLQSWCSRQWWQMEDPYVAYWSLDDIVALVQLVGPHLNNGRWDQSCYVHSSDDPTSATHAWSEDDLRCVRCLTDGLLRCYLQRRMSASGALSAMEKAVLRSTMEELGWFPSVVWPHVQR